MATVTHPDVPAPPPASTLPKIEQARAHFLALNESGEVREVRVLGHVPAHGYGQAANLSGYFDNADALAEALHGIGAEYADGIYITQNSVDPDLLARANNDFKRKPKHSTSDADITRRTHLTIDCDPVRKSGISSTDCELAAALVVRDNFIQFVTAELGWPEPLVVMMSGNGGQATWRIDLPVDEEGGALVEAVLDTADAMFSTPAVTVDTTLSNPSRIVKLSGTMARKGDPLPHRPHRRAHSEFHSNTGTVTEVLLRAFAALAPAPEPRPQPQSGHVPHTSNGVEYDVPALLTQASIGFQKREKSWGAVYELDQCLSSDDHNDGAAILQFTSGAVAYKCQHDRCAHVGWRDVKPRLGIPSGQSGNGADPGAGGSKDRTSGSSGSGIHRQSSSPQAWPMMRPLPATRPSAPTMPLILVPEPFRPWVGDIADRAKVPIEMVAVPAVVAAASAVGRAVGLRPNRYDDFTVVGSLWGALVAPPGWMKTGGITQATRPLRRLATTARKNYEQAEQANAIKQVRIEAEIKAIKSKMAENAKKGLDLSSLEAELANKRAEQEATHPTERRYLTHDSSVEKLGELLRDNPRGMLLLRDELSGWMRTLDKPGHEGDREFYLEAWNGTGSYTWDRIGRGTIHVPALTLSVFGGIQPGKLSPLVAAAVHGGVGDDGLVQRLQATVWPDRLPPWSQPTSWPDSAVHDQVNGIFDVLASLDGPTVGATRDDIPYVRYSPAAQSLADRWRDALEHRLRSDELDDTPAFAAHLAKYRSLCPTLAQAFYLIDLIAKTPGTTKGAVGEQYIRLTADWCDFLEAHARKVYAIELLARESAAHALAAKIEAGAVHDGQTVRDLYRPQWAGLRSHEQVQSGLEELAALGWVRLEFAMTGGRTAHVLRLHPELVERVRTHSDPTAKTDRSGGTGGA